MNQACLHTQCVDHVICISTLFSLLAGIDKLIEPLRTTIQSKAKANSVKQEFEKQDELKRSAMRAIAALLTTPDYGDCFKLLSSCVCERVKQFIIIMMLELTLRQ